MGQRVIDSFTASDGRLHQCPPETVDHLASRLAAGDPSDLTERPVTLRWDQPPFGVLDEGPGTVISAPRRAPAPPAEQALGVFVPMHAFEVGDAGGIMNLFDLRTVLETVFDAGGSFVGTLPLLAALPESEAAPASGYPSPYAPASRLFFDDIYLSLRDVPEWDDALEAQWSGGPTASDRRALGAAALADLPRLRRLRRPFLDALAERFFAHHAKAELDVALERRPHLAAFSRFMACFEQHGPPEKWSESAHSFARSGDALADPIARRHVYAQLRLHDQLSLLSTFAAERGLGLYLDLPVGVHRHGFDAYAFAEAFVPETEVGAPPDALFAGGQNWSFAPLHPDVDRAHGYPYWRAMLRTHCRYAGILRIDHIMGLERLFCMPRGRPATVGAYIRQHAEELYALVTEAATAHRCLVVGENLGTVPEETDRAMQRHGFLGMFVQQFGLKADSSTDGPVATPGADAVASLNTHDTPSFAAYWEGHDIALRVTLGHLSEADAKSEREARAAMRAEVTKALGLGADAVTEAVRDALLTRLAKSPAPLLLLNAEDLLGVTEPQNVPGTDREYPNWRRRHPDRWPDVARALRASLSRLRATAAASAS